MKKDISIQFKNVSKTYTLPKGGDFQALKPLNLDIYRGECFGLLGHNGAGKTTIISLLAGINKPTTGDIFVENISVNENTAQTKKLLGVVQQEIIADTFFNLPTMLHIQSKLSGFVPDKDWIDYLLEKLLLKDHIKKTTRELSGGMKRRMMIARALVHKPQILVLDEPTAGVDIQLRNSMWDFICELNKNGVSIILTTHYLQEAEDFCSRIAIIKSGEIVTLKENRDLLSLGGKHKICCSLLAEDSEKWIQEHFNFLRAENIHAENTKNTVNSVGNIKLSINYEQGNMNSFIQSSQKLKEIADNLNFKILDIITESPDLEDVFLKINDGSITV